MDGRRPEEQRGNPGECRSKVILFRNPAQAFWDWLWAFFSLLYSRITLLFQSEETENFRQDVEYRLLNQGDVTWYDGRKIKVTTAIDHVNGRLFLLYKVPFVDLMQRWIPELRLATYRTLCPKVYGFIYKKREGELFLLLKCPEQGRKSLRIVLLFGDMDFIKELMDRLFALIDMYHSQGVASLGITADSVYVIPGNFSVVFGALGSAVFQGFSPGFDQAKAGDVFSARNIILTRIPMSPLYFAVQTPTSTVLEIRNRILGIITTQETSYDLATVRPGFLMDQPIHPWSLSTGEHQLSLANEQVTMDADSQIPIRAQETWYHPATGGRGFTDQPRYSLDMYTREHQLSLANEHVAMDVDSQLVSLVYARVPSENALLILLSSFPLVHNSRSSVERVGKHLGMFRETYLYPVCPGTNWSEVFCITNTRNN